MRASAQEPPLSQDEWKMLKNWFLAHLPFLEKRTSQKTMLFGEDRTIRGLEASLRYDHGREPDSNKHAMVLRLLYAQYHDHIALRDDTRCLPGGEPCEPIAITSA